MQELKLAVLTSAIFLFCKTARDRVVAGSPKTVRTIPRRESHPSFID
jgi:hypothetical protein